MQKKHNRREFLKHTGRLGLGLSAAQLAGCVSTPQKWFQPTHPFGDYLLPPIEHVRIGIVGLGARGFQLTEELVKLQGIEICALCDIRPEHVTKIQELLYKNGLPQPESYTRNDHDFHRMCEREDLDLVITATPWRWHTPVCLAAMKNGKHAATEVPAALTIDQCWQLVETSEKTQRYCVMLENCCYDRVEMAILKMAKAHLLGDIQYGECSYLHDLRNYKLQNEAYQGMWRLKYAMKHDGNPYPTHGLGPMAQYMDINRGDKFEYLTSMSSNSKGLPLKAQEMYGPDHPYARQKYAQGDINMALIHTAGGKVITLGHNCNSPRPYSRSIMLQGTKGVVRKYPEQKIYIEGQSPEAHSWEKLGPYVDRYDHSLWKTQAQKAEGAGHGGMDYMEMLRLMRAFQTGSAPDMDVYDAASWSVIVELTEKSARNKGRSVDFPDFTRGRWKTLRPLQIIRQEPLEIIPPNQNLQTEQPAPATHS